MRIAFVGASEIALLAATQLIEKKHEVIIIESNREKIDELSQKMDCSFLHGDGSRPEILKEVDPESTDILFCLTNSDQDNLIASLVGRSLGFDKVITNIHDPQFENICRELGLEHVIVPNRMISRSLVDTVRGVDIMELSTAIKEEARIFTFNINQKTSGTIDKLGLPKGSMVACYYRNDKFSLPEKNTKLKKGDEVVILTHSDHISKLNEKFQPNSFQKKSKKISEKNSRKKSKRKKQ